MHHRPHDQGGLPPGVGLPPGGGLHPEDSASSWSAWGGGEVGQTPTPGYMGYHGIRSTKGRFNAFFSKNTINTNDSKLFQLILHDHLEVPSKWEKEFHMPNRLSSDITQDFNPCYFNSMPLIS